MLPSAQSIRSFEGHEPKIAKTAFVDSTAVIIGNVTVGENSSIWPLVVLRGDIHQIHIGENTSIQDGSIIHVTHQGVYNPEGYSVAIGNEVTIGHRVILHGCKIANRCLIGMGSCIMDGAQVESEVIIGAGSLIPPGKILTGGFLWLGAPIKKIRPLTLEEKEKLEYSARYYVTLKNRHKLNES